MKSCYFEWITMHFRQSDDVIASYIEWLSPFSIAHVINYSCLAVCGPRLIDRCQTIKCCWTTSENSCGQFINSHISFIHHGHNLSLTKRFPFCPNFFSGAASLNWVIERGGVFYFQKLFTVNMQRDTFVVFCFVTEDTTMEHKTD